MNHVDHPSPTRHSPPTLGWLLGLAVGYGSALAQDQPPAFARQPQAQIVVAGGEVSFSVELEPNPLPPTLQWYRISTAILGATNATLVLSNVQAEQGGSYYVIATNPAGAASSETVGLTVLRDTSVSGSLGARITLRVASSGPPTQSRQWRLNGQALAGATGVTHVITNARLADVGQYSMVASNAAGVVEVMLAPKVVDPTFAKVGGEITQPAAGMVFSYWVDVNRDGWLDVVTAGGWDQPAGKRLLLYQNDGQGNFQRVTTNTLASTAGRWLTLLWGDYDNDGWTDVYACASEKEAGSYFHNTGAGGFTRTVANASWTANGRAVYGETGAAADYDNDGLLDLVVGYWGNAETGIWGTNSVLHSVGGGWFEVDLESPLALSHTWPENIAWVDYNGDGHQDLFVATSWDTNQVDLLFQGQGGGRFVQVTDIPLVQVPAVTCGQAWGDCDNDGDLDVLLCNWGYPTLFWRNNGAGSFDPDAIPQNVLTAVPGTAHWGDYDNDGHLDAFVSFQGERDRSRLFHNRGDGVLEEVFTGSPCSEARGYLCAWGDYDNDGFPDLLIFDGYATANRLYQNSLREAGNTNHWLKVKLEGVVSNRDGIGATVRMKASIGGQTFWQMRPIASQTSGLSLIAHFGLGDAAMAEAVRVEWPSGMVQELTDIAANQTLTVTEPPRIESLGQGRIRILCWKHQNHEVEVSDDLGHWTSLGVVATDHERPVVLDPDAADHPHRFYRAKRQ